MSGVKDVVHIEEIEGPKGGRYWELTLSCGHVAFQHIRRFNPAQDVWPGRRPPPRAPGRKLCLTCRWLEEGQGA